MNRKVQPQQESSSDRKRVERKLLFFSVLMSVVVSAGAVGSDVEAPFASRIECHSKLLSAPMVGVSDVVRLTSIGAWNPSLSADGARIVFESDREEGYNLYIMNADGTDIYQLTNDVLKDQRCSLSPDGRRVAFVRGVNEHAEIHAINADGTGHARLTRNETPDECPVWSPDGSRIAFLSVVNGTCTVCTMNPDGTNVLALMEGRSYETPTWSPEGDRIAAASTFDGEPCVCIVGADGSGLTRLTQDGIAIGSRCPVWSPDGKRIAFHSLRSGASRLCVIDTDGSSPIVLSDRCDTSPHISWSPDGRFIAYESRGDLCAADSRGAGACSLTRNDGYDHSSVWFSDGERIAFVSDRDGKPEIYVMRVRTQEKGRQ
jgi:Tol biopolymer transport system component